MRLDVDLAGFGDGLQGAARVQGGHVAADAEVLVVVAGAPRLGEQWLDAPALLAHYRRHGDAMARDLRGAWAVAVVDAARRTVLLLTDRMSQHGWCYARDGSRLRASDRADTVADGAPLDPQALFSYLFHHVIPAPDTVFSGVRRLRPGHQLACTPDGLSETAHWQPRFDERADGDLDSLKLGLRTLLRAAVQREVGRLGEGASVGTFLSGGTDSSTVSGMLREVTGAPVHAYSIGFDAAGYDEMAYARIAARHFGLEHHEHYLTPAHVADGMPRVAAHYDQPFGNSSAVAAFHCASVARQEGRTALLAGDGGDELFGGNARYAKQMLFGLYDHVPGTLRRRLAQPLLDNRWAQAVPGLSKAASYVQQARVPMPDRLHMYNLLVRLGLDTVLTPGFRAAVRPDRDAEQARGEWQRSAGASLVNRMLAFDWKYTLADNDLPKVLGTAGLAGVATAFPLLADELVDFSLALPSRYKVRGQQLRWFFKEALRGFLPDEIIVKRKQGFGLPFGVWALRDQRLAALADDALGSFGTRGVIAEGFMSRLRRELLPAHPGYYGELVWIIAMLEFWLRDRQPQWRLGAT